MLKLSGPILKVDNRGDNSYIKVLNDDEVVEVKVNKDSKYETGEMIELEVRFSCYNNRLYCKEVTN